MKIRFAHIAGFATLFFGCHAFGQGQDTEMFNGHEVKARQIILKARQPADVLARLPQKGDADEIRALNRTLNIYVLHSKSLNVSGLINILQNDNAIQYVEPDYLIKVDNTPNDASFSQQWGLLNTTILGADSGATLAWDISTGSTANVAAVVDSGIDYTHPDLASNIWSAPAAFTVQLSWGQLTCPAGSHGYNAVSRSCDPLDDNGHGTHVAGIIGAVGNNSIGVAGVNWTTRMMGLKFVNRFGGGVISDAIDAIEFGLQTKTIFGASANIRVFSNSWGSPYAPSQALLDEVNRTNAADTLFVAAAGNDSQNLDTSPYYPAGYSAPNLIAVAATSQSDGLASFSSYGPTTVHLGAPGVNILSTFPNNAYTSLSGTSMATPFVSGAAMLLLSACTLSTANLRTILLANVDPVASLAGLTVTGGRLNVNKAIRTCTGTVVPAGAPTISYFTASPSQISPGQQATLLWNVSGADAVTIDSAIGDVSHLTSISVSPAQTTTYKLTATNSKGPSSASATLVVAPPRDTQPPSLPVLLSAVAKTPTEIDITWAASSDNVGVAGYQIIRNGSALISVNGNVLSYADLSVNPNTSYSYSLKAFDSAGNYSNTGNLIQTATPPVSSSPPPTGNVTIWPDSMAPPNSYLRLPLAAELGVKFRSDVSGSVVGIRFYKAGLTVGTQTGSLWSSSGALLATGTFTNETSNSWQTLLFNTPVSIQANTTYIASYHTDVSTIPVASVSSRRRALTLLHCMHCGTVWMDRTACILTVLPAACSPAQMATE